MKPFLEKYHRILFYSCWLLLGLMQSGLTELEDDEAYYWVYSNFLDWGYFDHPPMTGLLVKMGYAIFPNELGVRFFPLLLNTFSIFIIETLTDKKNPFLFYAIVLSMAALQVAGFMAVPDTPLIFFTALFFLLYKKFVTNNSFLNAILLGLSVALVFYSKYHAVLVVFFTLLSNWKLLGKYQTWVAGFVALLIISPHLWWQYEHGWVSFRYHLFESNVNQYRFYFTADYIAGQLLLPGPIAGFILLIAAFAHKPQTLTERALRFTMIGIYFFFLVSSFRGKVEANWTSPVLVPLVVFSHQALLQRIKLTKILITLLPVTLVLVLLARIIMIADILPVKFLRHRYHAWKEWPQEMRKITNGLPVVYSNSYQRASKYWFYAGQKTYSLNLYKRRKNNYNFWPIEDSLLGKPVYYLDTLRNSTFIDSLNTSLGPIRYRYDSFFVSFAKIQIKTPEKKYSIKENENFIELNCRFEIPPFYRKFILNNIITNDTVRIGVFKNNKWVKDIFPPLTLNEIVRLKEKKISVSLDLPKGNYFLRFAVNCGYRNPTHNSDRIQLVVD